MNLNIPKLDFLIGLDLGKTTDPSAVVGIERRFVVNPANPHETIRYYAIRFCHRWSIGTDYTQVLDETNKLCTSTVDMWRQNYRRDDDQADQLPYLVVDWTGVGQAFVDFVRKAKPRAILHPLLITGGRTVTREHDGWHVPKLDLASVLQVCLGTNRIVFGEIDEKQTLIKELNTFSVKITPAGNETFEAWRVQDHDDIVLATVIALWLGERGQPFQAPSETPTSLRPHRVEDRKRMFGSAANRRGLFGSGG